MVCKHLFVLVLLSISSSISLAQKTVPDEINKLYSYLLTSSNYDNIISSIQANKSQFRDTSVASKGITQMFCLNDISSFTTISSKIRLAVLLVNKLPKFRNGEITDSLLLMRLSIHLQDSLSSKEANLVLKNFRKKIGKYYEYERLTYPPPLKIRTLTYDNSKFGQSYPPFMLMMDKSLSGVYRILLTYTSTLELH